MDGHGCIGWTLPSPSAGRSGTLILLKTNYRVTLGILARRIGLLYIHARRVVGDNVEIEVFLTGLV
jgi:hypothetical protein